MPLSFTYIHEHTQYFGFLLDSKPSETPLQKATAFCYLGKLPLFLLIYSLFVDHTGIKEPYIPHISKI